MARSIMPCLMLLATLVAAASAATAIEYGNGGNGKPRIMDARVRAFELGGISGGPSADTRRVVERIAGRRLHAAWGSYSQSAPYKGAGTVLAQPSAISAVKAKRLIEQPVSSASGGNRKLLKIKKIVSEEVLANNAGALADKKVAVLRKDAAINSDRKLLKITAQASPKEEVLAFSGNALADKKLAVLSNNAQAHGDRKLLVSLEKARSEGRRTRINGAEAVDP